MDDRPNRRNKAAFSIYSGAVWTLSWLVDGYDMVGR